MDHIKRNLNSLVLLIATLIVNALGAMGKINNMSQKDVSNLYQTQITPSPFTFSIWSLIYILLFISFIVLFIKSEHPYYQKVSDEISQLFGFTCLLNMMWIVSFSYDFLIIASLFILILLFILIKITTRLFEINDGKDRLLPLSFGLYTGWLTIAALVNIAACIVKGKFSIFINYQDSWTVFVLILALFFTFVITQTTSNAIIPVPIAWAYFGILNNTEVLHSNMIKFTLVLGIAILLTMTAYQYLFNHYFIVNSKMQRD